MDALGVLDRARPGDRLVVRSPDPRDGTCWGHETWARFLLELPEGCEVLWDASAHEPGGGSVRPRELLERHRHLGIAWGPLALGAFADLDLGLFVGAPEVASRLRREGGLPLPSRSAWEAAVAAVGDRRHALQRRARLEREAGRLARALREQGLRPGGLVGDSLLVPWEHGWDALARVAREFPCDPLDGIPPDLVRLAVGAPREMARLAELLGA